jgi:hypothetical protein
MATGRAMAGGGDSAKPKTATGRIERRGLYPPTTSKPVYAIGSAGRPAFRMQQNITSSFMRAVDVCWPHLVAPPDMV